MRIEMIGPPTVGKSSLVRELTLYGIGRGFTDKTKKIPEEWREFRQKIVDAYDEHPGLNALPQKTINALGVAAYGDSFKGPIIYDELVANCGISMAIRHEPWDWYFEEMPMPGVLIVLQCSMDTLIERNEARGERSRVKKTMRAVRALDKILPIINRRQVDGQHILHLNTDKLTTAQCAREVLSQL